MAERELILGSACAAPLTKRWMICREGDAQIVRWPHWLLLLHRVARGRRSFPPDPAGWAKHPSPRQHSPDDRVAADGGDPRRGAARLL